jgi:pimeloyl-ACP methyl ester carboxylesterase
MVVAGTAMLASCVAFNHMDVLPVADRSIRPADVVFLAPDQHFQALPVSALGRQVTAYYIETEKARGVLFAIGGNGNSSKPLLRELSPRAEALGLDLVVLSYYLEGEPTPTIAEVRAAADATLRVVGNLPGLASTNIYLLGHSMGCWFATDLASRFPVKGLILASAGTTIAETFGQEWFPLNLVIRFGSDEDVAQLDSVRDAQSIHVPTIVFSSDNDDVIPRAQTQRVFDALPTETRKKFIVLSGVSHVTYLDKNRVWSAVEKFFDLPDKRP